MTDHLILTGDMRAHLADMEPDSVDAVICDPPYELGFMGRKWDSTGIAFDPETWAACLRVAKPGAHLAAFGGSRTWHRIAVAIEDAGWTMRDSLIWWYAQGFPKSLDVSKAIDAARDDKDEVRIFCRALRAQMDAAKLSAANVAGHFGFHSRMVDHWAARDSDSQPTLPTPSQCAALYGLFPALRDEVGVLAERLNDRKGEWGNDRPDRETQKIKRNVFADEITTVVSPGAPATDAARKWAGWGTALKPAFEPIILARKPLAGTVAANVQQYGTGAINVDGCRVGKYDDATAGRWPPNMLVSHADACVDGAPCVEGCPAPMFGERLSTFPAFYAPKASRSEREAGCEALPARAVNPDVVGKPWENNPRAGAGRDGERRNFHPTVKPISVMRWLSRLLCPPGGLILDPFTGSGTTGCAAVLEGFDFLGVELDPAHVAIAEARIAHHKGIL